MNCNQLNFLHLVTLLLFFVFIQGIFAVNVYKYEYIWIPLFTLRGSFWDIQKHIHPMD